MGEERINRKLAAILAADVVGYSRMMGADEAGTLAALKYHRQAVFDPAVAAHNGRIVKLIGDGTIVEFGSVVDAVNCALAVQRAEDAVSGDGAQGLRIVLRIGINLGDVIIEGDDIYGDGVNIAARLEPLAEPGGICVSSIVNESIGNRIDAAFRESGDVTVKNIDRPIRVWKWHPNASDAATSNGKAPSGKNGSKIAPALPTASIAILPFNNMSGDAEQEYFSDGISEDIITDLSKIAGLTVIARNSSFSYKGRSVDIREVGKELGVRSVLEGSIRRAGNRVRITAQLIDATNGAHLWAERYDRDLTDIFAVQDDVTRRIVEALKITLTPAEEERLAETETVNVTAYDCVLRGREFMLGKEKNRETFEKAQNYFREALEHDPNYSVAYACLGFGYMFDYQNRWSDDPDSSLARAKENVRLALEKGPKEPLAHCVASLCASFEKDLDVAKAEAETAIKLNPNLAFAHNLRGTVSVYSGQPQDAIPEIEQAMRLDPALSAQFIHFLGIAYLLSGKYETAATLFRQRVILVPNTDFSRAFLVSVLGHLGEVDEARRVWKELKELNPNYSFDEHIGRQPFKRQQDIDRIVEGMRKAGVL
jgi:adenylate cyclase